MPSSEWKELFNGRDLTGWRGLKPENEWQAAASVPLLASDAKLFDIQSGDGLLVNGPTGRTINLATEAEHADCELHIEFVVPEKSNSGVYFMGQYEIQVLDSWGASEIKYNSCGGIYCRWINQQPVGGTAPTVNASRPPGEWQSFDVIFRGPQFDESGKKTGNATFEQVIWNDEIVHKNVQVEGVTRGAMMDAESGSGPLMLQGDHGPVAYRNIRMRSLS